MVLSFGSQTDPSLAFQWRKNGTNIAGATTNTHTIEAVVAADGGTFSVEVSNADGNSVASTDLTVKAAAAPVITTQPRTTTASVGQAVTFSYAATGSYPRTHQWRRDGTSINGATAASYTIPVVGTADAGVYSVVVSNSLGSVTSSSASLTVNAATAITLSSFSPSDSSVTQGGSASFFASINAGSSPFTYQWMKNGAPIPGATASQLSITAVGLSDAGKYSAVVSNIVGSVTTREATLTVTPATAVTIVSQPRAVSVFPGQSASFSLSYNGSSPITFQWLKNGAPITGATNSSYSINSVTTADAGNYSAVLSNIAGTVTSAAAQLTVNQPVAPAISTQPSDTSVTEGSYFSVRVVVTGSPPLTIQWYKDGVSLGSSATGSSYDVSTSRLEQSGKYRAVATNSAGTVSSNEATVTILPPPLPPAVRLNNASVSVGGSYNVSTSYYSYDSSTVKYQWYKDGVALPQATQSSFSIATVKAEDAGAYFVVITNSSGSTTSRVSQLTVTLPSSNVGAWVSCVRDGDIVYFAFANPSRIERFNLATDAWLPVISLNRTPTALAVGNGNIYLAFGALLSRFNLEGGGETSVTAGFATNVNGLMMSGGFLLVSQTGSVVTSVRISDGAKVSSASSTYYWSGDMSIAASSGRIFSHTAGISPSDITTVTLSASGTLGSVTDSPYHGSYATGTRTYVSPNDTYVADNSGIVYLTKDLTFAGTFGEKFDDLAFTTTGDAAVLRNGSIFLYNTRFNDVGRVSTGILPARIFVRGGEVFGFGYPPSGGAISKVRLALSQVRQPTPAAAVDAAGLAFSPDSTLVDRDGVIMLYSAIYRQIFRWSTASHRFLAPLSLQGWPDFVTYSPVTHRVYLGYSDRRITQIKLDAGASTEEPFASAGGQILGLTTAGEYVFLVDPTGAWCAYYTFTPDGQMVARREWSYVGADYVWSPVNRRIYQFRDDTSPNDLLYTEINPNGTFGTQKDSPYHGGIDTKYPIRVSPDGSTVLLGSGKFFDATTMSQNNSLANPIDDAAWVSNLVITGRTTVGGIELQRWGGNNYGLDRTAKLSGRLVRMFSVSNNVVVVIVRDGFVYFVTYNANLDLISTEFGGLPNRLANISTRALVGQGDQLLIPGFYVSGNQPKTLLVRAAGPALVGFGVTGTLADPVLTVYNSVGTAVAGNDDWGSAANLTTLKTVSDKVGAFAFANGSRDSAALITVDPGAYTVQVRGANGTTGVALVEVYDAQDNSGNSKLTNIAARARVSTGSDALISGIVVQGSASKTLLIRAIGPGLSAFGVGGVLADPRLRVYQGDRLVAENNNWGEGTVPAADLSATFTKAGAFGLAAGSRDAALLITLPPGNYSAEVSGSDGGTGVALVEVYEVNN